MALASRIYVEGRHDAELVEQVWGEDLRIEGVVVEYLGGVDDLVGIVEEFEPGPGRRLGVLVDHLVAGSKEARIASEIERAVRRGPGGPAHRVHAGRPVLSRWRCGPPRPGDHVVDQHAQPTARTRPELLDDPDQIVDPAEVFDDHSLDPQIITPHLLDEFRVVTAST